MSEAGKEKIEEFVNYFSNMDYKDIIEKFFNSFYEFIRILNECDLSEETLDSLNGIFMKDMNMFFNNFCAERK